MRYRLGLEAATPDHSLEIPVTTDPSTISRALRLPRPDAITVVFCTYHSLGIVERAQDDGAM